MYLGNRRGGITPAEGCMFAAVALFVLLLIAMLYIAFIRFRDPRLPPGPPATVGALDRGAGSLHPPPVGGRLAATLLPLNTSACDRTGAHG